MAGLKEIACARTLNHEYGKTSFEYMREMIASRVDGSFPQTTGQKGIKNRWTKNIFLEKGEIALLRR